MKLVELISNFILNLIETQWILTELLPEIHTGANVKGNKRAVRCVLVISSL